MRKTFPVAAALKNMVCGLAVLWAWITPSAVAGSLSADDMTVNSRATFCGSFRVPGNGNFKTNDPVVYYSFTTNTNPILDNSGHGYVATNMGGIYTNGVTGGGYQFNGTTNQYLLGPSNMTQLVGATGLTLCAWVKKTSFSPTVYETVAGTWEDGRQMFALVFLPTGVVFFGVSPTGNVSSIDGVTTPGNAIPLGQWTHLAASWDGQSHVASLYLNGVLGWPRVQGSTTSGQLSAAVAAARFRVGAAASGTGNSPTYLFGGCVDEVMVFPRKLSDDEIVDAYLNTRPAVPNQGQVRFETGVHFVRPLGDLSMGTFTNAP